MIFSRLRDILQGKATISDKRSPEWPTLRKKHLVAHPTCAVCGGTKKLEVHHKIPFNVNPALELKESNLITLCESGKRGVTCHLFVGHLGNYRGKNPTVVKDAQTWFRKLSKGE